MKTILYLTDEQRAAAISMLHKLHVEMEIMQRKRIERGEIEKYGDDVIALEQLLQGLGADGYEFMGH